MNDIPELELEAIRKIHGITEVLRTTEAIEVKTIPIQMDGYSLGEYHIKITGDFYNHIHIKNLTQTKRIQHFYDDRQFHHPHIWQSDWTGRICICFGEPLKCFLNDLLAAKEYAIAITILLQFLQTAYGWHEDQEHFCTKADFLKYWPKIEEEEQGQEYDNTI